MQENISPIIVAIIAIIIAMTAVIMRDNPTNIQPVPAHQKCDTIISSNDTIFMYIKNH